MAAHSEIAFFSKPFPNITDNTRNPIEQVAAKLWRKELVLLRSTARKQLRAAAKGRGGDVPDDPDGGGGEL